MKVKVLRCKKCGGRMYRLEREWKCTKCGHSKPRFLQPPQGNYLFLNVVCKNEKTKRELMEILKPKPKIQKYEKEGLLFFRDPETKKIVDVQPIYKYYEEKCKRLVEEIRQREQR